MAMPRPRFVIGCAATALSLAGIFMAAASAPRSIEELRRLITQGHYAEAESGARALLSDVEERSGSDSVEAADVIDLLVESMWRGGRSRQPEAKQLAQRALAIREARQGPDQTKTAVSVRNLAIVMEDTGEFKSAGSLYERAISIWIGALGPEDPQVARALTDLANLHSNTGQYLAAGPAYERALSIQEKSLGRDHPEVARTINNLAIALHRAGDLENARLRYERALAIREKVLGPDHIDVAWTLNGLAELLHDVGEYARAESLFRRSLAIREKALGPDHIHVAWSLNNLANSLRLQGRYADARPHYERALSILEKTLDQDNLGLAMARSNVAELLYLMGDYGSAKPLYEQVLAVREKVLGANHPEVAASLHKLATLLARLGEYERARSLYLRALDIHEANLLTDHPFYAQTLDALAKLLCVMGERAAAMPLYEQALVIEEKRLGPDHPAVAQTLNDRANLLSELGNLTEARRDYERALAIRTRAMGPRHPLVGATCNDLAALLARTPDTGRALDLSLLAEEIGRDHVRHSARALSEREALRYASVRSSGLDLALALGAEGLPAASVRLVWDGVIRSRALVLEEMASRHRVMAGAGNSEIAALAGALAETSRRLANMTVHGPEPHHPGQYRALFEEAVREKEKAERRLAQRSSAFREEQARAAVGFAGVSRALPHQAALVAFAVHHRLGGPSGELSYLALVLPDRGSQPIMIPLGSARELDGLIARFTEEAARGIFLPGRSPGDAERALREAGETLRRRIWDPLAPILKGAESVFVVSEGALNLVNFGALPLGPAGYLAETGPLIHYLTAERDLVPRQTPIRNGKGLLAIGGPAFDAKSLFASSGSQATDPSRGASGVQDASQRFRGARSACGSFKSMRFEQLPFTTLETKEITDLWRRTSPGQPGDEGSVLELTDVQASEPAFKQLAPGRRVLHLATHGFFLQGSCAPQFNGASRGIGGIAPAREEPEAVDFAENPLLLSGLVLAGANHREEAGPDEEDGILTAQEIAAMDLSGVEWAVLSACDTGAGQVEAGEGVMGLRRAFQIAGARTVIMSLWPVDDESAREWMKELYAARLLRRLSTARSVREAGLRMLERGRRSGVGSHPFHWAGFVAAGDWR
jgi:tetratricopeptide (TPR) repeat protein/CHAT domain-containing protein